MYVTGAPPPTADREHDVGHPVHVVPPVVTVGPPTFQRFPLGEGVVVELLVADTGADGADSLPARSTAVTR